MIVEVEVKTDDKVKWKLFEKYDGWMLDNSGPIMDSEKNTEEELFEFAKKHREYDVDLITGKTTVILSFITLFLININIFFLRNKVLSGICMGINIACILICCVRGIVINRNLEVSRLRLLEISEKHKKELEKEASK